MKPQLIVNQQKGVVLLTTMIVMLIATMISMGMISAIDTDVKMVSNRQAKWLAENMAIEVSESILSDITKFTTPTAVDTTQDGYTISVTTASCIREAPIQGYSALVSMVPQQTFWEYDVVVTDPITGATATVHQGVKIKMLSGSCP